MRSEDVSYSMGNVDFSGRLVYDPAAPHRPTVLMAPSWMGIDQRAVGMAERLASRYVVFIADMYGANARPTTHAEAAPLAGALRLDRREMRRRIAAALATLDKAAADRGIGNGSCRAAIGFCFGGGNVLELARDGADIDAVVSFHGDLDTSLPAQAGDVKAAILILHGSADPVAPKARRDEIETELDAAGVRWRMMTYGGVLHSFTEPSAASATARYDQAAAADAFRLMDHFLAEAIDTHR